MPLYMDVHKRVDGLTPEAAAHLRDLAILDRYGVKYQRYWHDTESDQVFCLSGERRALGASQRVAPRRRRRSVATP